ncbi:hypothetical protein ACFYUY_04415 [Kitasatospora sp. NPDC004745]|uniref:hypothetical protein n=1 Tax=Kitasatospora sp. NPDC004745 TaxID=3364019 RepID=UPI0036D19FF9
MQMLKEHTLLVNVTLPAGEATLERVREILHLAKDEVDESYGIVPLDTDRREYTVLVTETAASRLRASGRISIYSNPKIVPFDM